MPAHARSAGRCRSWTRSASRTAPGAFFLALPADRLHSAWFYPWGSARGDSTTVCRDAEETVLQCGARSEEGRLHSHASLVDLALPGPWFHRLDSWKPLVNMTKFIWKTLGPIEVI